LDKRYKGPQEKQSTKLTRNGQTLGRRKNTRQKTGRTNREKKSEAIAPGGIGKNCYTGEKYLGTPIGGQEIMGKKQNRRKGVLRGGQGPTAKVGWGKGATWGMSQGKRAKKSSAGLEKQARKEKKREKRRNSKRVGIWFGDRTRQGSMGRGFQQVWGGKGERGMGRQILKLKKKGARWVELAVKKKREKVWGWSKQRDRKKRREKKKNFSPLSLNRKKKRAVPTFTWVSGVSINKAGQKRQKKRERGM